MLYQYEILKGGVFLEQNNIPEKENSAVENQQADNINNSNDALVKDINNKNCECDNKSENKENQKSLKKKLLWTFVFIGIAVLTIWAITSQEDFSFATFVSFLGSLHPGWLILAFASMIGIIIFEALAVLTIIKSFGCKRSFGEGLIYSSSDIYFSAITPSATGGQPACVYFMMRDGVSGSVSSVALVFNLVLYTFAIIILGILGFILEPSIFLDLSTLSEVLIIIGIVMLISLAAFFILILYKANFLYKTGVLILKLLAKIKLVRNFEGKRAKLESVINNYKGHVSHLSGKQGMMIKALIFNILQRASVIAVTLFTYLAAGGDASQIKSVWVSQTMVVLGSNTMPIPGAMGVSDYILIDAFSAIGFDSATAMNLNLISRAVSFYSCVIICGIAMIAKIISYKFKDSKNPLGK